jgi:hypothetical protein
MPQKRRKRKAQREPSLTHTHTAGASGSVKKTYVAEVLKSTRESGQQFGALDPHGDMLLMAPELIYQPATKLKRPTKKRS